MLESSRLSALIAACGAVLLTTACAPAEDGPRTAATDDPAYARFGARWPSGNIHVCWNTPGYDADKLTVQHAVGAAWEPGTPLGLDYWGNCSSFTGTEAIRLTIVDNRSASGIGRTPGYGVDVNLNFTFFNFQSNPCRDSEANRVACMKAVAIHEFGHALGLRHEQDEDDSICSDTRNTEIADGDVDIGVYDPDSVMNYCGWTYPIGRPPSAGDLAAVTVLLGEAPPVFRVEMSFASNNYPNAFIRHQYGYGELTPISTDLDRRDATFHVVRGFANGHAVSFESVNYPGYFLRHQSGRLRLTQIGTALDQSDATFWMRPGLAGDAGFSFESYNYPGAYIRHQNGHLYAQYSDGTDLFRQDATFNAKSLRNTFSVHAWDGTTYLRHRFGLAQVTTISSDLDKQDGTFTFVPGLADSRGVSLRSVNYPTYYLRHQSGRLVLTQISSALDQADATFYKRTGLAASTAYSFESYNYPGYYIHNRGGDVWVDRNAGTTLFAQDATWATTLPLWGP